MLLVRHIPHRLEPKPQRLARPLEDRPGGGRGLTLASRTSQLAPGCHPPHGLPTDRTPETLRPTHAPKEIRTGGLGMEPLIEFLERTRVVDSANGMDCTLGHPNILSLRERSGYPIKYFHHNLFLTSQKNQHPKYRYNTDFSQLSTIRHKVSSSVK